MAELLREVAADPVSYLQDAALRAALRSQGALGNLSIPGRAIFSMSLNHQKRVAEEALGSYQLLDDLRKSARDSFLAAQARVRRGRSHNKADLLIKLRELQEQNRLLRQDLFILQRAYDLRCVQARHYAAAGGDSMTALCSKEQREIEASLSLRRRPRSDVTVIQLEEGRQRVRRVD